MSRYLTPRTVFVNIKFWSVGDTVFTPGVVLLLGVFCVATRKTPRGSTTCFNYFK